MSELDLCAASLVHSVLAANSGATPAASAVTHKATFEFIGPSYSGDLIKMYAEVTELKGKHIAMSIKATAQRRNTSTAHFSEQ